MHNISAVILAAGSGTRIGVPKLKLKHRGEYYVNLIISKLKYAGIEDVVCVIRKEEEEWFKQNALSVQYLINDNPETGMIHSVYLGINHFKGLKGVIVFPVDHPFVKTETITKLKNEFEENNESIVKPLYDGVSGHPIIIPKRLFGFINGSDNLNLVIQKSGLRVLEVIVNDEGILKNINYIEDLNK